MSGIPDVMIADVELTMPVKSGQITGNERLPIILDVGVAASEIDLRSLIGESPGAWITFELRDAGPIYIGMNKSASSATSITAGDSSLGKKITAGNERMFWVTKDLPFCEAIADAANSTLHYYRSCPNRRLRNDTMATGH